MVATVRSSALPEEMTIDELARESGMTVRNIRAYQSRGLLPPPEVRARTGFYGPEHLARLKLVNEIRAKGISLRPSKRVLDGGPSAEGMVRFGEVLLEVFTKEQRENWTPEEV